MPPYTRFLAAAGALLALPLSLAAQDVSARPTYGTLDLSAGFTPDPLVRAVTAGGRNQVQRGGCTTHIHAAAPDLDLNYRAGGLPLTITANSSSDVMLLINTPDGRWHCNDDGGEGTNASITFSSPQSGNYNIWVGTYRSQSGNLPRAEVVFTERSGRVVNTTNTDASSLNWRAQPTYGTVNLSSGFTPDPYVRSIAAGGSTPVPSLGDGCRGYVNGRAPDLDLNYQAGRLPLNIYATSGTDITLVINLPNGNWICSDDVNGTNPHVHLGNPLSGNYNIWIGTYSPSSSPLPQSTLYISEVSPRW